MAFTAFDICQRVLGTNHELNRLYERLTALQSMVSCSAPPTDSVHTTGSHSRPDKIGDYVSACESVQADIKRLVRLRTYADRMIKKYIDKPAIRLSVGLYYLDNLSTYKMADLLGVSQPTVSRYRRQGEEILKAVVIGE